MPDHGRAENQAWLAWLGLGLLGLGLLGRAPAFSVDMDAPARMRVVVRDLKGNAVPGAEVTVNGRDEPDELEGALVSRATTDEHGVAEFVLSRPVSTRLSSTLGSAPRATDPSARWSSGRLHVGDLADDDVPERKR